MSKGMSLFLTVTLLVVVAAVGMTATNRAKKTMDKSGGAMEKTADDIVTGLTWDSTP